MKTPLVLRYFLWSMLIFAVSMFCLSFRILDSQQYKSLAVGAGLRYGAYWKSIKETELPYRIVPIYSPHISQEKYFDIVRDVVHQLKVAGAKVVIVPIPVAFQPSPRAIKIIQEIVTDSIVVFGVQSVFNSLLPWERDVRIDDKSAWWVRHPFFNRLKIPWGVMSTDVKEMSPLIRFAPVGFRESDTGEPVSDVATLALKRYFDIPDGQELPRARSRLLVGPLGIQIEPDGVSYLRFAYRAKRQTEFAVSVDLATDSLQYIPGWDQARMNTIPLKEAWPNHKGCIVMIDWDGGGRSQYVFYAGAYQQIFGAMFGGSFLSVHNEWNVLLITTLVILLSVFSYTVRNGLTVLVSFVLAVAAVLIGGWLFTDYGVLFEPIYILVPIMLCGLILPLVKMSGEKRIAEEKIKTLEEENRRLLDLQRLTPPQVLH